MNITVIVQPPFEPVALAEVYKQLRLDPDVSSSPAETSHPDDAMLLAHIQTAREFVEIATRRSLVQRTIRLSCSAPSHGAVLLRRPPLQRVLAVSYFDGENLLQTLDEDQYYVTDDQVPELRFLDGCIGHSLHCRSDALRVDYVAGYTPEGSPPVTQEEFTSAIPQTLKQAVLIGVQMQYDNLSDSERTAMERMREALLQTYRIQHV